MTNEWQGEERRSHPRILLSDKTRGSGAFVETSIVDLSQSGALLEVPSALPAKSRYLVRLVLEDGRRLELSGEVVRSYVHGFDKAPQGVPTVKYRAAIQFVDLTPDSRRHLESLLGSGHGDRKIS
ncbi:MAG: PilZ domain-containing protein [Vicinamibacteria bacterium]